jgi:hypothetical protein
MEGCVSLQALKIELRRLLVNPRITAIVRSYTYAVDIGRSNANSLITLCPFMSPSSLMSQRYVFGTAPLRCHRLSFRLACTCMLATLACIMQVSKPEL